MAYYWVTEAQLYLQSLGFGSTLRPVEQRVAGRPYQPVRRRQLVLVGQARRAALRQGRRGRRRGRRGHPPRVRPRAAGLAAAPFGFGASAEAGAIGEGFADYWAVTVSQRRRADARRAVRRRLGLGPVHERHAALPAAHRPEPALPARTSTGSIHRDGQIWSRALWDIRRSSARRSADTLIVEGIFGMKDPTMPQLATSTVDAAARLYGLRTALASRQRSSSAGSSSSTTFAVGRCPATHRAVMAGPLLPSPRSAPRRHRSARLRTIEDDPDGFRSGMPASGRSWRPGDRCERLRAAPVRRSALTTTSTPRRSGSSCSPAGRSSRRRGRGPARAVGCGLLREGPDGAHGVRNDGEETPSGCSCSRPSRTQP